MPESSHSPLRVGIVVTIGLGILAFAIASIGHGTRLFSRSEILQAHFRRINGLQVGASVRLAGVSIGAVDSISFPRQATADYVLVRMWIERSAAVRVHADSVASIESIGMLGDKYVELSPGNPASPVAPSNAVLPTRNPINYEALLEEKGTGDLIANLMAISADMRQLLHAITRGRGILGEMVSGAPGQPGRKPLTLASIRRSLDQLNAVTIQLTAMLREINHGRGLAGAMVSGKVNGEALLRSLSATARRVRDTSRHIDQLVTRVSQSQGLAMQLVENREFANRLMRNLDRSSAALADILQKIDTGRGTAGLLVNDPSLYYQVKGFVGDGGGWGLSMVRGLYSLTHPFSGPPLQPVNACPATPDKMTGTTASQGNR